MGSPGKGWIEKTSLVSACRTLATFIHSEPIHSCEVFLSPIRIPSSKLVTNPIEFPKHQKKTKMYLQANLVGEFCQTTLLSHVFIN